MSLPADATQAEVDGSCAAEIGQGPAQELADLCRAVSPATRPPCHPLNPCDMIRGEIDRGCSMFPQDEPDFAKYCS